MRPLIIAVAACSVFTLFAWAQEEKKTPYPSYAYEVARPHEIKPHRRTIPLEGVRPGFNQLRLTLKVSATGDVLEADAGGDASTLKFWPSIRSEVRSWKFKPFEQDGKAVTAEVEEYVDLVPPERLPKNHIIPPLLGPESAVMITLERTGCYGACPSYTVTVSTTGIIFEGYGFVVASGSHRDTANPDEVRGLAKKFIDTDFYSMDASYRASVTDNPTYILKMEVDGRTKEVEDYVGSWQGMPAAITDLENQVDEFAGTGRWIEGDDGLVEALKAEKFHFRNFEAQIMLKESARRGAVATLRELLTVGVPLYPLQPSKLPEPGMSLPFQDVGWLNAASAHEEALKVLIEAGASKNDQNDKDLALVGAARSGNVDSAKALIAYGANPNADLNALTVWEQGGGMALGAQGAGNILIYAAESGNPEMVKEILQYHPKLEARDFQGRTAVFSAAEYRYDVEDTARAECVRLLAQSGADVNARDRDGNTPLHETFLGPVEEELLKLGADVNARNNNGETPIFTTVDDTAVSLFIAHGADLTIRNNKGETVFEAAKRHGPLREEALHKAVEKLNKQR
jgi:ankyrin repeat protein